MIEQELDPEGVLCIHGICMKHGFFSAEQWEVVNALMDSTRNVVTWHYTHLDWSKFNNKSSIIRKIKQASK